MASTYTNTGIEKPATGEQSGTWGGTVNTNFDIIDQAVAGFATVTLPSAGSSGTPNTITITDGATSDGRNAAIEFDDGADLGATSYVQLTPSTATKVMYVRNSLSGGQDLELFQGTYSAPDAVTLSNGYDAIVIFNGGGASAVTRSVIDKVDLTTLSIGGTEVTATAAELNILDGVTSTAAELNILDGVTSTAAELNILDGVTATAAELNYVDGVTSNIQTQLDARYESGDDITANTIKENHSTLSGTTPTIDCNSANSFDITLTGNTTFSFSNVPSSGTSYSCAVYITGDGSTAYTVTYPASVVWTDGTAPDDPGTGETDVIVLSTHDGGTTWYGFQSGDAMS